MTETAAPARPFDAPPGLIGPAMCDPPPHARPMLADRVTCGFPSPAEDHMGLTGEGLDLNQKIIRNPVATYFCEADSGESMIGEGIYPGDFLVCDRSIAARPGDVVIVLWEGGYMVKRLRFRQGRYELHSGHPDHKPIIVPPDVELEIWGVVTWAFHPLHGR